MRIVVASDFHLDHVTMGVPRFAEVAAAADQSVARAIAGDDGERADLYLFAGDLTDPDSGSTVFRCVHHAVRMAAVLSDNGVESHWVAGNHDVIEDAGGHTTIYPIEAVGEGSGLAKNVFVHEAPWKMLVPVTNPRLNLVVLPFTATSHPYDPADFLARSLDRNKLNVVVGHLVVPGIQPGEETVDMPRGREVLFPVECARGAIAGGYRLLCINGHYHRRQSFDAGGGLVVHVPGSLARLTAGEESHEPGFLEIEVEG